MMLILMLVSNPSICLSICLIDISVTLRRLKRKQTLAVTIRGIYKMAFCDRILRYSHQGKRDFSQTRLFYRWFCRWVCGKGRADGSITIDVVWWMESSSRMLWAFVVAISLMQAAQYKHLPTHTLGTSARVRRSRGFRGLQLCFERD